MSPLLFLIRVAVGFLWIAAALLAALALSEVWRRVRAWLSGRRSSPSSPRSSWPALSGSSSSRSPLPTPSTARGRS